ncbi:MAG: sugar kinase, partial [Deltaproteobacteria bacterium]|nr:sugar kinase [Deltaproteobacteria bacterium]
MPEKIEVVGLGQASVDYLAQIKAYPEPDAKCECTGLTIQGGGPAATAMVTLSRLGVSTAFIGAVGADVFGRFIRGSLIDEGVDVSSLVVNPGGESQFAFIAVEQDTARRNIFWHRGGGTTLEPDQLNLNLIRAAKLLHLDGLKLEACLAAARTARDVGIPVVYDAGTLREGCLELAALT